MGGYIGSKGVGIISGIDASIADLNLTDKAAANGVTEANKVLTADANKDVTAIRNLSATGNLVATVDVTAGGSITATGASVGALARGAIQTGNASGVAAPLTKGAEGTVLTAGANDLSWVAASGGGEQTFTATGAISAGDIVGLNSDGTISASEAELQAAVAQGSGASGYQTLVYDTANNKVLLFFYAYDGGNYYLHGRVGTIANGQISFGTAVSANIGARSIHAAYDANSGKTVVTFSNKGGNNYPYAVVVTVSGTNLSFGTPVAMKSSGAYTTIVRYDSNAQKVLCIYNGTGNTIKARVGTVSGTSISFGSETVVSTYGCSADQAGLVFDSNANKFLMIYTQYGQNLSRARVLTISGTSVSSGTEADVTGSFSQGSPEMTFIPGINKIIATFNYSSTATYYQILAISGTSLVLSTSNIAYSGYNVGNAAVVVVAGDKQFLSSKDAAGEAFFVEVEVTATELIFAPTSKMVRWGTGSTVSVYDPDTGNIAFADPSNVRVFNPAAPSFVGIAAENISNGATGTVTVIGGINTSVSGLTAGKTYGSVASTAALTEIGPDGVGAFGVALSSSSIYLNAGKL